MDENKAITVDMSEARQWLKVVGAVELGRRLNMRPQSVRNMISVGHITLRRREQLSELSGHRFSADEF